MKLSSQQPLALPERITLVAQTVQILREGIRSGRWHKELPGERKLSGELQVGRHTLRAALDELQRDGWIEVVGGQRRTINHKRVRRSPHPSCKEIVMLAPGPSRHMPFDNLVEMSLLRDNLHKAGHATQLYIRSACFSAKPTRALKELTCEHPDALWIILGSKEPLQRWLSSQRKPCMIAGSCDPQSGLSSIDMDYHATCCHAVGVFLRKGHHHIALVLPRDAYGGDIESEKGFLEGVRMADGQVRPTILRHDRTKEHLCAQIDIALQSPVPPTAFLVAHSLHVITVMTHLMRRGKSIPRDMAVISRNGDRYLDAFIPTVARYVMNPEQFARRFSMAVRQLAETGTLPPRAIRLTPEFIAGETV